MNFSSIFILRPIMTVLLMVSFMLAGGLGYYLLPINSLPKMDFPTIQVSVSFPGTSAETMARTVALPLEHMFSAISGIETMNSVSAQGKTQITLQFNLGRDIDAAAQDVGSAISAAQRNLPSALPNPPIYLKINPAEKPVLYISINSQSLMPSQVDMYARNYIADRISMLPGVAQVDIQGSQKYAVRIYANPQILAMRGLTLTEVSAAISDANILAPSGIIDGQLQVSVINPNSGLQKASDFEKIIIREEKGVPLRLKDIASVQDGIEDERKAGWFNQKPSVLLAISRQPGANTVEVIDSIRNLLPQIKAHLPHSLNVEVLADRSEAVRDALRDVKYSFLLTMVLVIGVIYFFLNSVRATFIPSVTLPIAIIGTFCFMYILGYSLNNLTLLALTLAIGYIVDDAIVVLENINHHVEQGMSPLDASIIGTKEISFTVLSMTLSLGAVFIPLIFMQGIVGRLFHEFAITITIVIMISCFISLTLTPMMSRFLLTQEIKTAAHKPSYFEGVYNQLENGYKSSLNWVMKRQKQTLYFFVALFCFNIFLFMQVNKGFFPTEDTGFIFGSFEGTAETSFDSMKKTVEKISNIIAKDKDILDFNISLGGGNLTNSGRIFISLKPIGERKSNIELKIHDLKLEFHQIAGVQIFLQPVANLNIGALSSKSQYQYTLQGTDLKELYKYTQTLEQVLKKAQGFWGVTTDLQLNVRNANVNVNRDKASMLGVSMADITRILGSAFGGLQISTIYNDQDSYKVILEIPKNQSRVLADLSNLFVKSKKGNLVRLDTLAQFELGNAALTVNHFNENPCTTISFNLDKKMSLGEAVSKIEELEISLKRPQSITGVFQGTTQAFKAMQTQTIWLILASVITMYMILGMLYESYIHPITILSSLPTAGIGALIALIITGMNLDVISLIGLIMLIGIVKKNAIMMIDYSLVEERIHHKSPENAIIEAAHRRFRPIMMTTLAAIMGILPITFGLGAGAELRQPLGIAVAGGLLVSQVLTLYITPVIYIYLDKLSKRFTH